MKKLFNSFTITSLVVALFSVTANAALIRVSQETSAGAGDFDSNILGYINPWTTSLSTKDFYAYGYPNDSSYNGHINGGPLARKDKSISFFVETADGLSFYTVHDRQNAGNADKAGMSLSITGDTAAFMVGDEPKEGLNPGLNVQSNSFTTNHKWFNCCTDGFGLGVLEDDWTLYAEFDYFEGLSKWKALSYGSQNFSLAMGYDQRVRFEAVEVPEPSAFLLIGLGLVGLGFSRKMAKK